MPGNRPRLVLSGILAAAFFGCAGRVTGPPSAPPPAPAAPAPPASAGSPATGPADALTIAPDVGQRVR